MSSGSSALFLLLVSVRASAYDGAAFVETGNAPPVAAAAGAVQPTLGQIPPHLVHIAAEARHLPLSERIAAISAALLDRPYVSDPLGEGVGHDADPFARYDVFDCLTFVEEVLALALSPEPAHGAEVRNALRYGSGERSYATRRHFMELEWIPGNVADGWLVDTTKTYGETVRLEREVTAETWRGWSGRKKFAHTDEQLPTGPMALDVLPLETARAQVANIRPGSILLTVREDRSWVPIWTTHVGFVVGGEQPTLRHATKMGQGLSRDHALAWYLEHIGTYDRWKTLGVVILEPVEQGPRLTPP